MLIQVFKKLVSYKKDKHICDYIKYNRNYFKSVSKTKDDKFPVVLFEFNSMQSAHISYSYLANVLAKKYKAKISAFIVSNQLPFFSMFEWKLANFFSLREFSIYRSFGVSNFILPRLNSTQIGKAKKLYEKIITGVNSKADVDLISVDGVWLGDLIYDSYLRMANKPTIQIKDKNFERFLLKAIEVYIYWKDYFDSHEVMAVNVGHCVYIDAIPLRIAISRKIPSFQINATHLYHLSEKKIIAYTEFTNFREVFNKLSKTEKQAGLELAEERIKQRFEGMIGVDMIYSEATAFGSFKSDRLIKESSHKKILIATHCFFDSPHAYGGNLFPDLYEWIDFLGQMTLLTNYDWYIKPHPDPLLGTMEVIESFVKKYPRLILLPGDSSHHQIISEGIDVALTVYGTIGFEYAALGIPIINASKCNPHIAFDFNIHPKSITEYKEILLNIEDVSLKIDIEQVREYYFMKNLYNSVDWLFKDYNRMIKELGGYRGQFTSAVYGKFLNEISHERHMKIFEKLERFVASGDFRLDKRHG